MKNTLVVMGVLLLVLVVSIIAHRRLDNRKSKGVIKIELGLYFVSLVWVTLLSRSKMDQSIVRLGIRPLLSFDFSTNGGIAGLRVPPIYEQSWLNILMFVPLGYLMPIVLHTKSLCKAAFIGVVFSFFVEILQLITKRGWFDLDDIFLNAIGTIIGSIIIRLFWKFRIIDFEKR